MTRWEYLVVAELSLTRDSLNTFGSEGWELVNFAIGLVVFKRPLDISV